MAAPKNKDTLRYGNSNGEIKFGNIDKNGDISAVLLRSGDPSLSASQYIQLNTTGKVKGGITNRCPGPYQIKCGDDADQTNNIAFVVHAVDGDIIIGAPNGRVRIFGETVDIIADGGPKKGNINLSASNGINMNCKEVRLDASAAINFITSGKAYMSAKNTFYINAGLGKLTSNSSSPVAIPPAIGNLGPKELVQTVQKILGFLGA